MALSDVIDAYIGAWGEPDRGRRERFLDTAWVEDGTYTDPSAHVVGRIALVDHIGVLHEKFPGARFELTSGIDAHHRQLRFGWRMVLADGKVALEGTDFGELSADGRLHRIVGFFGPLAVRN